jgi:type VI secretion system secreted protein VgrG
MAILRAANESLLSIRIQGVPEDELRVLRMHGEEGISRLFEFELELVSENPAIAFANVVGQSATLTFSTVGADRHVNGIVSRFEQGAIGKRFTKYSLHLVPRLWRLQHRVDCRIFQERTTLQIVEEVLQEAGIPSSALSSVKLKKSAYGKREYCVQYQESDWDFVSRLLEEEGIFYFFEHTKNAHVLVLGDDTGAHGDIPGDATVVFREPSGFNPEDEYVGTFRYAQSVHTGAATLRDYSFERPKQNLETRDQGDLDHDLAAFEYPGFYSAEDQGGRLAIVRRQEREALRRLAVGHSVCRRLVPGYRFTVHDHSRQDFNAAYLITHLVHNAYEPQALEQEAPANETETEYGNEFRCIPSTVPFRPRRTTRRPAVRGPQSAVVVGPKGEEIYTDPFGRIKVQFHWDRRGKLNEHSSCWIRVATPWAGAQWGAIQIPRIGWEVMVAFLDGDLDRPIVIASLYNANQMPPYALPDNKTQSGIRSASTPGSAGFNEIKFEDKKGGEQFAMHAQKDMSTTVLNDQSNTVQGNFSETITKNATITIAEGTYNHDVAAQTATYHVKGAVLETFDATQTTNVKNNITVKSLEGEILVDAANKITLHTGESKIELLANGQINIIGKSLKLHGDKDVKVDAPKIAVEAAEEGKIGCSTQNSRYTPQKTEHSGVAINSSAVGMHEITGAVVKIN